jgi:hypothetical protein
MKHRFTALTVAACLFGTAQATTHRDAPDMNAGAASKAPTAQQTKMATCNKDATGKTGDDRKAFMKECLSAKPPTQQEKMTLCNKDATGKSGDERKAFMKECLSARK